MLSGLRAFTAKARTQMMNPPLPKSYKKRFPFSLATTSYIYPDDVVPNVSNLAPFLDEIELVLFESKGENNLPDVDQLRALMNFSLRDKLSYNVHLPIDLFLGDRNEEVRSNGVSVIKRFIQRTFGLRPSVYTLHFDPGEEKEVETWQRHIRWSARKILECGVPSRRISVETLGYPFEWVEEIVKEFDFSICLDIGHILISGYDLEAYFEKYLADTSIIHLHGFENGTDHLGIDRLPESSMELIFSALRHYEGILSLEVFSLDDLRRSLIVLEEKWPRG
jgi:sugar phosphate isomerase/epimerase